MMKKINIKKILYFALPLINLDSLICSILVLLNKPKDSPIEPPVVDYTEMANNFSNNLLSIINSNIDELGKTDPKYDMNKVLSLSIDESTHTLRGGVFNDNYLSGFTMEYASNIYDDIANKSYNSINVNVMEIDTVVENPLINDNDFKEVYANSLSYRIGKETSPIYRTLSCSFVGKQSQIYSISPYVYEIGSFSFKDIPSYNVTIYNKDDSKYPWIYLILKNI